MNNFFRFLIFLILTLSASLSFAGAMLGGEITWSCQPNGSTVLKLTRYADCTSFNNPDSVIISSPAGFFTCYLVDSSYISPTCNSAIYSIACDSNMFYTPVYRFVYQSNPVFLAGTIPVSGWEFYYSEPGRPKADNITNPVSGYMIRSIMYPQAINSAGCLCSSPQFSSMPQYAFNTEAQEMYTSAYSVGNKDSVYFEWAEVLDAGTSFPSNALIYDTAYSFSQPLPGSNVNPLNVNAQLMGSGRLIFKSVTTGKFATCISAQTWRNGQKVAEVFRDLQFEINQDPGMQGLCGGQVNNQPLLSVQAVNNFPTPAQVLGSLNALSHHYLQVLAGDTVWFQLNATDLDLSPSCYPQLITASGYGSALSDSLTGTSDCINEPCALLQSLNTGNSFQQLTTNNLRFFWVTDTSHVSGTGKGSHWFTIDFRDDHCVLPGVKQFRLLVEVLRPIVSDRYDLQICQGDSAGVNITGNTANLQWSPATGISCTNCSSPKFSPTTSTNYSVTDLNTNYKLNISVGVDQPVPPIQFSQTGASLTINNISVYDTVIWYRNKAPFTVQGSSYVPFLSGTYQVSGSGGACSTVSQNISMSFSDNLEANPGNNGSMDGINKQSITYGATFRLQNENFYAINGIYVHAFNTSATSSLSSLSCKIFDNQLGTSFNSDSVWRISDDLIFFSGEGVLGTTQDYLIAIYVDQNVELPLFRPSFWPMVAAGGRVLVFNAAFAPGNGIPSSSSQVYPFFHFSLKWHIGVDEVKNIRPLVYPNPAKDVVNIEHSGSFTALLDDLSGKRLLEEQASDKIQLDISRFPQGVYVLTIESEGGTFRERIVVSK